jgi:hypothetical protein
VTRLRVFVAALAAAGGMFAMVGAQPAGAIIINVSLLEGGPPSAPPPPGDLLSLCLRVRPAPANCISI